MRRTLAERFWPKVNKGAPDECWHWMGAKTGGPASAKWDQAHRYGYLGRIRQDPPVPIIRAHVASWIVHHGPVPEGQSVLHHCDDTLCVNPAHLFLGTRGDNNRDRSAKGRDADRNGLLNPNVKLSPDEVAEIRRLHALGSTQLALAQRYRVTQQHVSRLVRGINYPLE